MSIGTEKSVEREIEIAASPQTVWEMLVEPKLLVRWMGMSASLDLRPGGAIRQEVIPGKVASGTFVEIDAPRRLVYTWGWEPGSGSAVPPGSTTVVFELVPRASGTLLRFSHRDLPSAEAADSHRQGWEHYLSRLATLAGGADPGVDPWISGPMK
jgi:uncharacterized protein YndB with AHSA1/START domain